MDEPKLQKRSSSVLMDEEESKQFKAFKGGFRRLDGKEVVGDPVRLVLTGFRRRSMRTMSMTRGSIGCRMG